MRKALRSLNGRRLRFTARVTKQIRKYYRRKWGIGRAILLEDIWLDGTPVADHVWTEVGTWVKEVSPGDLIAIRASVYRYNRADGYSSDFGLKDVWLCEIENERALLLKTECLGLKGMETCKKHHLMIH